MLHRLSFKKTVAGGREIGKRGRVKARVDSLKGKPQNGTETGTGNGGQMIPDE